MINSIYISPELLINDFSFKIKSNLFAIGIITLRIVLNLNENNLLR